MSEHIEALPCPFCGGEPMDHAIEPHTHSPFLKQLGIPDHGGSHVVECGCGVGLIDDTKEAVLKRWNTRLRALSPAGGDWVMVPPGLLERVKAAEDRINAGHSIRRIPADLTDPDLVMCEVRLWLEGRDPPCWIKPAASPQQEPGAVPSDDELTGMWERADLIGGATDCVTPADESGAVGRAFTEEVGRDDKPTGYFLFESAPSGQTPTGAGSRESRMVVLRRDASGIPSVWCDPEISDLVAALNTGGVPTVASCSGHGERHGNIALKDGRELLIASDFDTARAMDALLLTATSAGTTGDAEDAARLDAAIDAARRARGETK